METEQQETMGESAIRENLASVQERIRQSARRAGRAAEDIRLVVVTKAQPVEKIRAVVAAGATILGENYPEETLPKQQAFGRIPGIEWHMIGHLQSRKIPLVVGNFDMLQSLDSLRLAEKLDRRLAEVGLRLPVLLEMNVSGEESKSGWAAWEETRWDGLLGEVEQVLRLPNLAVRGLMTMPPYLQDVSLVRPYFERLRRLGAFFAARWGEQYFLEASMGTSADFETAIEEGATLVRVGQAVVGQRPAKRV